MHKRLSNNFQPSLIIRFITTIALGLVLVAGLMGCNRANVNAVDNAQFANEATDQGTSIFSIDIAAMDFGYEAQDLDASYDEATATKIALGGSSASIDGQGATSESDGNVSITNGGVYLLSGELSDGQIAIDSPDAAVHLVLNGATMKNNDGPALFVKNAPKVYVTLAPSTTNVIADGANYANLKGEEDPYGAVFSNADITVNGSGTLEVSGAYKNGLSTMGVLAITGGIVDVTAVEDSLYGYNAVKIHDGSVSLTPGQDAIKVQNENEDAYGFASIDGGSVTIKAGNDGVKVARFFQVSGGELALETTGDGFNSDHDGSILDGQVTVNAGDDAFHSEYVLAVSGGVVNVTACVEGYEAEKIYLQEGTSHITSSDDAVNASAPEAVKAAREAGTGGQPSADAAGAQATGEQPPTPPSGEQPPATTGEQPPAPLSGEQPSAGTGEQPPTPPTGEQPSADTGEQPPDLPEQATPPEDMTAPGLAMEQGQGGAEGGYEDCLISISGGYLAINAEGDGLDSNGSVEISGGTVLVAGPTDDANSAFDYELSATITGGTVIMAGPQGMAQSFTGGDQPFALATVDGTADSSIALVNDNGEVIASFTPGKAFKTVLISAPGLTEGQTMQLVVGGTVSNVNSDGYTSKGTVEGGTSSEVTFSTRSTRGGGMGGPPGMTAPGPAQPSQSQ